MTQNLLVFMCDTQYQTLQYAAWSGSFEFAYRSFIITGEPMQVSEQKWLKKSDFVLNLNNKSKDRLEIALRAALLYSSPKFENIIFIYDQNLPNLNEIKKKYFEIRGMQAQKEFLYKNPCIFF